MKMLKRVLLLSTVMAVFFSTASFSSGATKVIIAVDDNPISISSKYGTPYIDSASRTMVPIRVVSEKMGGKVTWDPKTQTVMINGNVKIKIGSKVIESEYGKISMDTNAIIKGERTYIPYRFVGEALGYDVNWHDASKTANIRTKSNLTISAAASLKNALDEVKALYIKEKPNASVSISYAGSGTLQQQIEQGAPVDLFFSAATSNMNTLKGKGLIKNDTTKNLLQNKVVMIVPKEKGLSLNSFKDITNSSVKKLALGEPVTVPAGKYAEQVFTYYKLLDQAKSKAVYAKDVTEVLTWVANGNVDAGVVYSTDASSTNKVKVVATAPETSHTPVDYPAAVIKSTKQPIASQDFLNYLSSDVAKAVFIKHGFTAL